MVRMPAFFSLVAAKAVKPSILEMGYVMVLRRMKIGRMKMLDAYARLLT